MAATTLNAASGHGVSTCMQSRFVRLENEQFSSNSTAIGKPITVTGELKSLVNRNTSVLLIPIDKEKVVAATGDKDFFSKCNPGPGPISPADIEDIAAEWQVVNTSYSTDPRARIDIEPGGIVPFSMEIESAKSGTFRLVTGYIAFYTQLNGTETGIIYLGRGQTVQVQPTAAQMQTCRELGIEDNCGDRTILAEQRLHDSYWIAGFPVQYLIGVGAAIAATVAFFVLKKSR